MTSNYTHKQPKDKQQPWNPQTWGTTTWDWNGYDETWSPRSPRTPRSNSPRAWDPAWTKKPKKGNKGQGKGKGTGKGKEGSKSKNHQDKDNKTGKGSGKGKTVEPEPPWKPPPRSTVPTVPATPSAPSAAEASLQALIQELSTTEGLSAEAQRIMKENRMRQTQSEAKAMHGAVTKLGTAKKQYQTILASQQALYHEWYQYLAQSSERWKTYLEEFCSHDKQLTEDLQTASKGIKLARAELKLLQEKESKAPEESKTGAETIDDISDEDLDGPQRSVNLMEGMQGIIRNLDSMQKQAEETMQSLEPRNKKAKVDVKADPAEGSSARRRPPQLPLCLPCSLFNGPDSRPYGGYP